ncbi:hypothetical protein P3H15_48780 [Rhodococcus sp. T2V]|uniref:hypothetical protein n=1 Tax=Rhodococcus sp. T2V TaxID=3034164 RepID=UPI0023E1D7A5|nr:hypothetical protein [Rhodococcus sp. T2V]MDF3312834.1 hypothetical protein [Rhodococcus sp. T2V]
MRAAWPPTEREEELRFIDRALRRTHGPGGVILADAAGVGKTRLAREALTVAARRGAVAPLGSGDGTRTGTTTGSVRRAGRLGRVRNELTHRPSSPRTFERSPGTIQ